MVTNNAVNLNQSGLVKYDGAGTFTSTSVTQFNALVGGAANAITSIPLTNGQLVIGSTGVVPVAATITAGTGIGVSNGAGTITINATGGGIAWSTISGTTQTAAVDSGYVVNNGGLVTITLPAVCAAYSTFSIVGLGAGGWIIAQNAGQNIQAGAVSTTIGAGGTLASTNRYDVVNIVCTAANTTFAVTSMMGNLTVV